MKNQLPRNAKVQKNRLKNKFPIVLLPSSILENLPYIYRRNTYKKRENKRFEGRRALGSVRSEHSGSDSRKSPVLPLGTASRKRRTCLYVQKAGVRRPSHGRTTAAAHTSRRPPYPQHDGRRNTGSRTERRNQAARAGRR